MADKELIAATLTAAVLRARATVFAAAVQQQQAAAAESGQTIDVNLRALSAEEAVAIYDAILTHLPPLAEP